MDFVAIDFETATSNANSACQLGIACVSDGEITEEHCWYIRPPRLYFSPRNIAVHGIRPQQVVDAPNMCELWPEVQPILENQVILAHNARFDIGVLVASLAAHNLHAPAIDFSCTRLIARSVWPGKSRYGLKPLADWLQFRFKHHDALEDARCCAMIALAAAQESKAENFSSLEQQMKLRRGRVNGGKITSPSSLRKRRQDGPSGGRQTTDKWGFPSSRANRLGGVDASAIVQASAGNAPLSGRRVVLLGPLRGLDLEETRELIERLGGTFEAEISPKTTYVVACGTTLEKAGQLVCEAVANSNETDATNIQGVRLLSERQFRALLPGGKAAAW